MNQEFFDGRKYLKNQIISLAERNMSVYFCLRNILFKFFLYYVIHQFFGYLLNKEYTIDFIDQFIISDIVKVSFT